MTKSTAFKDVNQGTTLATGMLPLTPLVIEGLAEFQGSFDRLCLRAGTAAIEAMLAADAEQLCGKRYERHGERQAYRWGLTASEISYHGGKASIRRSRVRKRGGAELELPSWRAIQNADLLSRWAFNQMLIGVATRKYARSIRLPDGDLAGQAMRAKALSRAVRDTFGDFALIQRCQIHKGRNIIERLDRSLHASVKKVLRQAWDSPTAEQAERVLKNLARRLDHDAPGVSASILEGLDEMLTVIRLGLPNELRRSLSCTNAIESLMAVLRQVCRNVKHWRDARMALRWTATAMLEAEKSFRRLKAHKQLPLLRAALLRHQQALLGDKLIASKNLVA